MQIIQKNKVSFQKKYDFYLKYDGYKTTYLSPLICMIMGQDRYN